MKERAFKSIIVAWFAIMCSMDYFGLSNWQSRLVLWGTNALLFAVWITKNVCQRRGFVPLQERGILVVSYLFLFWACISIFFSKDPYHGIKQMGHLLIALVDAYIFYDFLARGKENVLFFCKAITFFVLGVSVWATLESLHKLSLGEELFKNIYAGFCNPNFLGHFLFLFFPLMISYYFTNSYFQGEYKIGRFILLSLIAYSFILSSARSSWNGFIFALCFLVFQKSKPLGTGVLLLTIIVTLSFYILGGSGVYESTWQKVTEDRPGWTTYWKSTLEHPYFGLGWGVNPPDAAHAHNLYLSNSAQMGIMAIFLVVAFYVLLIYGSYQTGKRIKDLQLKAILVGSTATFFGHMIYSLTDIGGILVDFTATSMNFFPYILLAVPLAITYIHRKQEQEEEEEAFYEHR